VTVTRGKWIVAAFLTVPLIGLGACSHKLKSPKVDSTGVEPDTVCNVQLETDVLIAGDGFAPLVTKSLEDKRVLILPSVDLQQVQNLEGNDEQGEPLRIPGDPAKKHADALSWQSQKQMTLTVSEGLDLDPGLYDVTVTNPDGAQKSLLKAALAVVPAPTLSEVVPPALCNAQSDQEVQLIGTTFLDIDGTLPTVTVESEDGDFSETFDVSSVDDCTTIPGRRLDTRACTQATFTIPAETLEPGDYSVSLTNPEPANCTSTQKVTLTVNPPPRVSDVAPSTVCTGGSDLDVFGKFFQDGATVELRCEDADPMEATHVEVLSSEELTASFGPGLAAGDECEVVVLNPDGCYDEPPHQNVTGVDGPIAFFADPPVSYTDQVTRETIFLTAITGDFEVSIIADDGTETVLDDAALVAGAANRLQASIPSGLDAGTYDISVQDETGCRAVFEDGITLTDTQGLSLAAVTPPFAQAGKSTAVTLERGTSGSEFEPTPRAFLMPSDPEPGDVAIQLGSVTVVDGDTLTAVVPATSETGTYDVVIVDANGTEVGVLPGGFQIVADPPPVIDNVVPQSVVNADDQVIELQGTDFADSGVSLICQDASGDPVSDAPNVVASDPECSGGRCTQTATVDASGLGQGSVCVVRVTNADDTYGDFSAIGVTNSSYNLSSPKAGEPLQVGRRAPVAAAVKATRASRFLYAIGGDSGAGTAALRNVEIAAIDIFGGMNPWRTAPERLGTARALAGSATLGRYVYVFGGTSDGSDGLTSAERALVLSPEEAPVIRDVDLCLNGDNTECFDTPDLGDGLDAGVYSYRVSALIDKDDEQNLGGETLASDPLVLRLPTMLGRNISVELSWGPPRDALGEELSGIVGYRVYRTPQDGVPGSDEVLLTQIDDASQRTFIDDGTASLGSGVPQQVGATSAWQALPALNDPRVALAGAGVQDPGASDTWYVYALLGRARATGGSAYSSYEHLTVTVLPNGRQTVGNAWTMGGSESSVGRSELGAWVVDAAVTSLADAGETWIFVGSGALSNGNSDGTVEAALVQAGGELGAFDTSPEDASNERTGYGVAAAADRLFAFGGRAPQPRANAIAAELVNPLPNLARNAWNNEGLTMTTERYLPGSAMQSAFIFLVGGESSSSEAQDSTELVVW
jgi:hypothetical protein